MAFDKEFNVDENTGEITREYMHGGNFAYNAQVDIKAFLQELHDLLQDRGYKDYIPGENVGVKNFVTKGEAVDPNLLKRTSDMYEVKFVWLDKGSNSFEVEFHWKARRKSEMFDDNAHLTFTLNLVNRHMTNNEIVEGNSKKVLQTGTWEHRNKLVYTNNAVKNMVPKFEKIPFISTKFLIKVHAYMFVKKNVEHDLHLLEKKAIFPIKELIEKHFAN